MNLADFEFSSTVLEVKLARSDAKSVRICSLGIRVLNNCATVYNLIKRGLG